MKRLISEVYVQYLSKYAYILKYTPAHTSGTVLKCTEHNDEWDKHYLRYDGTFIPVRMKNCKHIL